MNAQIIVMQMVIFCLLFLLLVVTLQKISPLAFISDYPPEIQKEYWRANPQQAQTKKEKISALMLLKKGLAAAVYLFVFAWMMHAAGAKTFLDGVLLCSIYFLVWFAWDTFFLDWILFPRMKLFRLPGTEHMDKEYRQKWFHVKVCLPVIPFAAAAVLLCSGLMVWIW
jgi:hypothetical protein